MHFNKRQIQHHQTQRRPDPGNFQRTTNFSAPQNQPSTWSRWKGRETETFPTALALRPLECSFHASKNKIQRYTLFAQMENQHHFGTPPKSHGGVDGSDDFFPDFKVFR